MKILNTTVLKILSLRYNVIENNGFQSILEVLQTIINRTVNLFFHEKKKCLNLKYCQK